MQNDYLTYSQLSAFGITGDLIRKWKSRNQLDSLKVGDTEYVRWSSVPERTRSKYSQEEINRICNSYMYEEQSRLQYNSVYMGMRSAYDRNGLRYRDFYTKMEYHRIRLRNTRKNMPCGLIFWTPTTVRMDRNTRLMKHGGLITISFPIRNAAGRLSARRSPKLVIKAFPASS